MSQAKTKSGALTEIRAVIQKHYPDATHVTVYCTPERINVDSTQADNFENSPCHPVTVPTRLGG